ncbi:hypothetical protein AB0K60_03825 [Thermopolyspora sp. NPDC052614]|uniref:hypothetical protein n=1 Tax=Thermopolyspora sp. NPDC052614 TaxID=3155682 RepID=UPI003417DA59
MDGAREETTSAPEAVTSERPGVAVRSGPAVVPRHARVRAWAGRHRWFLVVFGVAAALRVTAALGFRPVLWFPDSYTYVVTALRPSPDLVRPAGYSMFLRVLEPFHSFAVVAFAQHLFGLAMGVVVYVVAGRFAPRWMAVVAASPVLLDAYQIQLERLLVSDTLFALLVVAATGIAMRRDPGPRAGVAVGLLLAGATLTRSIGLPLIVVVGVWFLSRARGRRWRRVGPAVALAVAVLLPVGGYAAWFWGTHHRFGLVGANGVFLYARTMSFADCAVMRPPGDLAVLCDPRPPSARPPSQEYIWDDDSPLVRLPGITFLARTDALAGRFAVLAIRSQPLDYLASVAAELVRSFTWGRPVYPTQEIYDLYEFPAASPPPPSRGPATLGVRLAEQYERGPITTSIVEPYAGILRGYQDVARLPGTVLVAVLLVPPLAAATRRLRRLRPDRAAGPRQGNRRPSGEVRRYGPAEWVLPWTTAVVLLVVPAATAEFDYRYVLPAVPLAFLAGATALRRHSDQGG